MFTSEPSTASSVHTNQSLIFTSFCVAKAKQTLCTCSKSSSAVPVLLLGRRIVALNKILVRVTRVTKSLGGLP